MSPIEAADRQDADEAILATRADTEILAGMLAEAFHNDALTRWITPDENRRRNQLPDFFRVFLEISLRYDAVYTNASKDAALLFLPPGGWEETEKRGVELSQRFAEILGDDVEAMATISGLQAVHHPTGRLHYYVSFAGVDPNNQRRGAMSTLLQALIDRADAEGFACYTEASSAGGTFAARRAGFVEIGHKIEIPDGPTLRPMWREPR
ncbi:ribosomal protein S18 acetylase RimI-like enzyme [Kibdelosporangium banguiense]|uniref:Ribosomal protein S18 acetylase RimI-like enzyme n=1 Tax=Kibdelosporangium banguiense TaxID=1365924 RepID=A0ABS4TIU2_9PSEU|nr:GNAT family N-acetyltransferase [Kibdelosporangium banguiense]MBP2324348.1 ribosomal protein S18 acetylase RimI-like enzyme [Kibdelosporangium banguiense]